MTRRIYVTELIEPAVLRPAQAADYINRSKTYLWRVSRLDPSDPRHLAQMMDGNYAVKELNRWVNQMTSLGRRTV